MLMVATRGVAVCDSPLDWPNAHRARLNGLHVTPATEVPVQFKPSRAAEIEKDISADLKLDEHVSAAIFKEEVQDRLACTSWSLVTGDVVEGICDKARYADLVILGQYERQGRPEGHPLPIAHSVVPKCGRPVLVVPGAISAAALTRVAVVWDPQSGSHQNHSRCLAAVASIAVRANCNRETESRY